MEVFGENIWGQTYLSRVGFDSEEEADKFIESLATATVAVKGDAATVSDANGKVIMRLKRK